MYEMRVHTLISFMKLHVNSYSLETAKIFAYANFVLHSAMKTHLLTFVYINIEHINNIFLFNTLEVASFAQSVFDLCLPTTSSQVRSPTADLKIRATFFPPKLSELTILPRSINKYTGIL